MPDMIARGLCADGKVLLKAESNEDAAVFALRSEFERLIAARSPLARAADGLGTTFNAMVRDKGYDAATAWSKKVNLDPMLEALEELNVHADRIAEQMIALEPKTPRAIAAVTATLKEDGLGGYWDEPHEDPDWSKMLVTRFLDALIAGGPGRADTDADRAPA